MKKKWSKNEDEHFQLFTYAILETKKLYHMKSQLLPILVLSLIIWLITFSSNIRVITKLQGDYIHNNAFFYQKV